MSSDFFDFLKTMGFEGADKDEMLKTLYDQLLLSVAETLHSMSGRMVNDLRAKRKVFNPYEVLGIQPGASREDVDKAYLRMANKCHPDKGGTNEAMTKINLAKELVYRMNNWR